MWKIDLICCAEGVWLSNGVDHVDANPFENHTPPVEDCGKSSTVHRKYMDFIWNGQISSHLIIYTITHILG